MPRQGRLRMAVALAASAVLSRPGGGGNFGGNQRGDPPAARLSGQRCGPAQVLPAGWDTDVATSGGAKDCNLRMIFIDRIDVNGPDGAPKGTSQLVIIEVTPGDRRISRF